MSRRSILLACLLCLLTLHCVQWATVAPLHGQLSMGESVIVSIAVINESDTMTIDVLAVPEKRIPPSGNDATLLTVEVRTPGQTTPLYTTQVETNAFGGFSGATLLGIAPGTYDLTAKGYSHLRVRKENVTLYNGAHVDFSEAGAVRLLSGDVNLAQGDNYVNGMDLSLIVANLLDSVVRYDLNRDGIINGMDLSNAVSNLLVSGDA